MRIADIEDLPDTSPPKRRATKQAKKTIAKRATEQPEKKKREREYHDFHLPQPPLSQPEKLWMTRKPEDFFAYFMSLKEHWTPESEVDETQALLRCYVYRKWPQIDNGMVGNRNSYIDRWHTWPFWDEGQSSNGELTIVEDYRAGMLSKWGSGTYRIVLNDIIASKPIAELTEWVIRPENINSYPPVLNYKTLLMDVVENKTYITWRQQTGLPLPGEMSEEQSNSMANPVQDKMMEKVIERAFEDKPIAPVQVQRDTAGDAAAVGAVQLMANVVEKLMNKPEPPQQPQQSPESAITLAVTLIEKLQPKGNSEVMEMIREDRENTRRENAELRKQLLEANRPKSLKEQLEEMQALKELMGGSTSRPIFRKPEEPSFLDKHGPTILQLGSNLLGAWMQQQQQGKPMQAQAQAPEIPQAPQQTQQQPQQQQQQTEGEPNNVNMMIKMVQQYLDPIALPLFNHLKDNEGEDFADWLQGGYGDEAYKQAAGLEFGLLLDAISTHPVIGKLIAEHQIAIEKLGTFIEHFKNPEKYWVEEPEGEEQDDANGNVINIQAPQPPTKPQKPVA